MLVYYIKLFMYLSEPADSGSAKCIGLIFRLFPFRLPIVYFISSFGKRAYKRVHTTRHPHIRKADRV